MKFLVDVRITDREAAKPYLPAHLELGWASKSGLGNPGVQALGAHSEQLE